MKKKPGQQQGNEAGAAALHRQALEHLTAGRAAQGIALLEQALALAPQAGALHTDLGTAHLSQGHPEKAETHYRKAVRLSPKNPYSLNKYGAFLLAQGRTGEAGDLLKSAYALKPDHCEIPNNLGLWHYRRDDVAEAGRLFAEAVRLNPLWPQGHANLGNALRDTGRYPEAEKAYLEALKLKPGHAPALSDLGYLYVMNGRDGDALDCYHRATALSPRSRTAWTRLLGLLESMNRIDEAFGQLEAAKRHFPDHPGILRYEAKLLDRRGQPERALALMEACRARIRVEDRNDDPYILEFLSDLGQLYDRTGAVDEAFTCFREMKDRQAAGPAAAGIDKKQVSRDIARVRAEFTPAWAATCLATAPGPDSESPPVFLIGFPRSGTTLLDQILSSHPDIAVAEEKNAVETMAAFLVKKRGSEPANAPDDRIRMAACLETADADELAEMRRLFFAEHGKYAGDKKAKLFVDKLPLNILQAALIRRVFPEAKFILALRHPCDSVLSCYMQNFRLNDAMARFLELGDAALFYDEAFSLWEQYRAVLPLNVFTVRYEDVVADFRPTVETLLGFLGLPWNDAVLQFDKTARDRGRINTPSYRQVTEKIYTRAAGRWLRYKKHLAPVLDILAPHAERYGYALDEGGDEDRAQ